MLALMHDGHTKSWDMIAFAALLVLTTAISIVAATPAHRPSSHIPNVYAVQVNPSVSCKQAVVAAMLVGKCRVVFRTNVRTSLASLCSYEVMNVCDHNSAISGAEGFVASYRVRNIQRPKPLSIKAATAKSSFNPQTEVIHNITGVLDARYTLGLTGTNIKVAVIDTGVYYLHPALGGGFGPGFKVAFGYDLVGDNYDGSTASIVPDNNPIDDCSTESHGTHVAGIVAANALNITTVGFIPDFPFTGVAPDATLGAYRVFGCAAAGTASDILASAILRAAQDGADVINLSIGGTPAYSDEIDAVAAQTVGTAGHIVLAAGGNDGASGAYVSGDPGVSLGGLGIASFDNVDSPAYTLYVDGVGYFSSLGVNNGNFSFGTAYSGQFVLNNANAIADHVLDDGCTTISANVEGKAVLLYWANPYACGSAQRCNNVASAGASACIIYYESDNVGISIAGANSIPSLITTLSAGKAIIADLAANKSPVFIPTRTYTNFPSLTGGTLSSFSSPGLSNELYIKPDLGGIGGNVYSTISPFAAQSQHAATPYAVYSGTSMATPYVAGCTALLLQKRGKISFNSVRAYLQNTATVTNIYNTSLVSNPAYQGAGLVNIYKAATSNTLVTPSALSLNDTAHRTKYSLIKIQNNYATAVTYQLTHVPAATANTFHAGDDFFLDQSTTTFTTNNIAKVTFPNGETVSYMDTIKPGKSASLRLHITAPVPASADLWATYGGYIAITNSYDDIVTHVPYAGVAGVWKNRDIWARNSSSLYTRWGLQSPTGPLALFQAQPTSVATGLYADATFTPLTNLGTINARDYGVVLAPAASTSRSANITITYLCNNTAVASLGLPPTNFVALLDLTEESTSNTRSPYYAWVGGMERNTYIDGQSVLAPHVYGFDGSVFTDDTTFSSTTRLPAGVYQMNFVAWKNFGNNNNVDVIASPPFQLVYSSALSKQTLAQCQS
jgi:subtilisin family serine protease